MKCLNPLNNFFHCLANGGGVGQNVHLSQSYRKVDAMLKSTEQFFSLLANGVGCGGQNVHLNQSYRKVDEMPKSTEQFFFIVWPIGGGRGGVRDQNVHLNQSYRN